jgi:D-serine deaminase-like pyridoxal phosphate-dependent protein
MKMCKLEVSTPALLLDVDRLEHNLKRMADFFSIGPTRLRPHFKNHKCLQLAKRQIAAGAIGMTCATLDEADAVIGAGINNVLIANEIASSDKLERFVELSKRAELIVCIDNADVACRLAAIAKRQNVIANVVIDIDVGLHRCGIPPGQPAMQLAKAALRHGLRFRGVMGYEGQVLRKPQGSEKEEAARHAMQLLVSTKDMIEREGIPVEIVSAGGTGSYEISGRYPGVTEIQAGSYLVMDTDYATVRPDFEIALTMLTSVISKTKGERVVVDSGLKSLSCERGLPQPKDVDELTTDRLNAEHGVLKIKPGANGPEPGDKIEMWVHYGDATINLHHQMYGIRNGVVEEIFPICH